MQDIVGNKAKWRISKRMFQENKARRISEKRTFLTPWYAYTCEIRPLPYYRRYSMQGIASNVLIQ